MKNEYCQSCGMPFDKAHYIHTDQQGIEEVS
jgi:hypothetical protein